MLELAERRGDHGPFPNYPWGCDAMAELRWRRYAGSDCSNVCYCGEAAAAVASGRPAATGGSARDSALSSVRTRKHTRPHRRKTRSPYAWRDER